MGAFGAYGKMPGLGDFFRVGMDNGFVAAWDTWLQGRLTSVPAALGDRWERCYMSAPIWRFTLAPGLAGAAAAIGVLMPSVDRVGRKFPLTFAARHAARGDPLPLHFGAGPVFAALEEVAIAALEDEMTPALLKERLAGIGLDDLDVSARVAPAPGRLVARVGGAGALAPALAASLARSDLATPSIWSAHINGDARLMACEGLPDEACTLGLVDLDASIWGPAAP